jgi:hypothetical protein
MAFSLPKGWSEKKKVGKLLFLSKAPSDLRHGDLWSEHQRQQGCVVLGTKPVAKRLMLDLTQCNLLPKTLQQEIYVSGKGNEYRCHCIGYLYVKSKLGVHSLMEIELRPPMRATKNILWKVATPFPQLSKCVALWTFLKSLAGTSLVNSGTGHQ